MQQFSRRQISRSLAAVALAGLAVSAALAAPPIDGVSDGIETDPAKLAILPHSDFVIPGSCIIDEPKPVITARGGAFDADVFTIINNGPVHNRVDLVFVGDGYTAGELATYAVHCENGLDDLFGISPFSNYRNFFNAHRVEVISNESGIDHDPNQGDFYDTAMNMGYWCNGIERLLCVGTFQAFQYAENAPEIDQIFAVANSSKYGGAGYPSSDLGTYAGGNSAAPDIAIHELGHAMGDLADEYTYGGPETYTGAEPLAENSSKLASAAMAAAEIKWHDWLGSADEGGTCGTFEGSSYSVFGVYRPTNNSMMRNLGRPFNNVSKEELIIEIYREVTPIDSATPPGFYNAGQTLEIDTVDPIGHQLTIQWYADGEPIAGANGNLFLPGSYPLGSGQHEISVTVVDNTTMVRDEAARQAHMTDFRDGWTVTALVGDINGDCVVDAADLGGVVGSFGGPGPFGDLNGDGVVDAADLGQIIANFGQTCE